MDYKTKRLIWLCGVGISIAFGAGLAGKASIVFWGAVMIFIIGLTTEE